MTIGETKSFVDWNDILFGRSDFMNLILLGSANTSLRPILKSISLQVNSFDAEFVYECTGGRMY